MLDPSSHLRLTKQLLEQDPAAPYADTPAADLPAARYLSPEVFLRERRAIFGRKPIFVAAEAELREPGACLAVEVGGVSLLLVRDNEGGVGAFRNACRHRGTELLAGDAPCVKKAIVCRYHGWTYDLRGMLLNAPHAHAFDGKIDQRNSLVRAHAAVRHGFVWASLEPFDLGAHLGAIDDELAALSTQSLSFYRRSTRQVRGNWKLIIDAFLDGYHIRHLHKDTLYRFFLDARFQAERAGEHIRAVTARRPLREVTAASLGEVELRQVVTPSYLVFPHTVVILHPDYLSVLCATPLAPDLTRFVHMMWIPAAPRTEADEAHWAKSFALIDDGVFAREDLSVVEAMQRGLATGANDTVLFGRLEHPALWFHQTVDRCLDGPS